MENSRITVTESPKVKRGFGELRTSQCFPVWYCVKTLFNSVTGKMESEVMKDEESKMPITIRSDKKPLDGVYETAAGTTYYTYHDGYEAADKQVRMTMAAASI